MNKWMLMALAACAWLAGCVVEPVNDPLSLHKDMGKAHKAYIQIAMSHMQRHDMTQADVALRKAAAINDDSAELDNARGLFFLLEEDEKNAEKYFKRAISEDAEYTAAYNNYGTLLYKQKRCEDVLELLEPATRHYRYEKRYQIYETIGHCHVAMKHIAEAEKAYMKALQINGELPESLMGLANIEFDRGNYAATRDYLTAYEKFAPRSPAQLWLGIRLQRQLGDKDKLASYELALRKLFPGSPQFAEYEKTLSP